MKAILAWGFITIILGATIYHTVYAHIEYVKSNTHEMLWHLVWMLFYLIIVR